MPGNPLFYLPDLPLAPDSSYLNQEVETEFEIVPLETLQFAAIWEVAYCSVKLKGQKSVNAKLRLKDQLYLCPFVLMLQTDFI